MFAHVLLYSMLSGGVYELSELCMSLFLWTFVSFMSFCVTFALYEFMNFVSFVYLICSVWVDELCETFALMWLCWPFTSSWGVSICFDLLICTRSVLTPFLERSCVFVSIVSSCCPFLWELRLLILRDLVFAFSLGFWISWIIFLFFLLRLIFCYCDIPEF